MHNENAIIVEISGHVDVPLVHPDVPTDYLGVHSQGLTTRLDWSPDTPYLVRATFLYGSQPTWDIGRGMLLDALRTPNEPVGEYDLVLRHVRDGTEITHSAAHWLQLELTSPSGHAWIRLPQSQLWAFVANTLLVVPPNLEWPSGDGVASIVNALAAGAGDDSSAVLGEAEKILRTEGSES